MPETVSGATDALLHPIYGKVGMGVETSNVVFKMAEKQVINPGGGQSYKFASHLRTGPGIGVSSSAGDVYPTAGSETYVQGTVSPYTCTTRFSFDSEMLNQVKTTGAFAASILDLSKFRENQFVNYSEILALGDGTGNLGKTEGTGTATTALNMEYHGGATVTLGALGIRNLQGFAVMVGTTAELAANPPTAEYAVINDYTDSDTGVLDRTITYADADRVVNARTSTKHDGDGVFTGLDGMIKNTGTYLGISRDTYARWQGTTLDNGGTARTPSISQLRDLKAVIAEKVGTNETYNEPGPSLKFVSSYAVWKYYANTAQAAFRFNVGGKPSAQDLGTTGITFDGDGFELSRHCKTDRTYGIMLSAPSALVLIRWGDWQPRVRGLSLLPVGENNQLELDMWCQMALASFSPRAVGAVTDLNPTILDLWK